MLHQFLKNLSINKYTEVIILASVLFFSINNTYSQTTPGLYESFETLISIEDNSYSERIKKLQSSFSNLIDLKNTEEIELDPQFINHILFYSPSRYASLATKDKCSLYDLILSGLLRDKEGSISKFLVKYKTRKDNMKTALVSRNTFLEKVAFIQCPQSKTFAEYFQLKNIKKTLSTIILSTPTSHDQCLEIHDQFINDYKTPYLCQIYEQIDMSKEIAQEIKNTPRSNYKKLTNLKRSLKLSQSYKKVMNVQSYDYLKNLCLNIEKPKKFCSEFFDLNFWKRVANGERSSFYIENMCKEMLGRDKLTKRQLQKCARSLNEKEETCLYLNKFDKGLTPKLSCTMQSKVLNLSHLYADYNDCPALTGNDSITNISRVLHHLDPVKAEKSQYCQLESTYKFAKFNSEASDGRFWNVSLCYEDKINQTEVCLPTLMGDYGDSELSISKVVANILKRTRAFGNDQKCRTITESEYKPALLEFKGGCFIILSDKNCTGTNCKFKIINNEKEVTHIKYVSDVNFSYFPEDFIHENLSQFKLIERHYKKRTQKIINISFLKTLFKKHPKAIIQGIGCREDLLPSFFQKKALNQCSPIPFLVDGYKEVDGALSLVVRTAYDDLHSPRLISWSYIFSAVKAYQNYHPINLWGLYAIY